MPTELTELQYHILKGLEDYQYNADRFTEWILGTTECTPELVEEEMGKLVAGGYVVCSPTGAPEAPAARPLAAATPAHHEFGNHAISLTGWAALEEWLEWLYRD